MKLILILSFCAWPVMAGPSILSKLQAAYDKTTSFEATFKQSYWNKLFDKTDKSSGKIVYQKPGKMRWDYEIPTKKSFILNKKNLWLVEPEEKMAQVNKCFDSDALTASLVFLGGRGKLSQQFNYQPGSKSSEIILTPKTPNGVFESLNLTYDPKTYRVTQTVLTDVDGNTNEFRFEESRFNRKISTNRFQYVPEPGVELTDMPGSCGSK